MNYTNKTDLNKVTFRQLKSMVNKTPDQRIPGVSALIQSGSPILFMHFYRNEVYTIFKNGYFIFQRGNYHTVYAVDRIKEIKYSFNDGTQVIVPEEEFADSCCLVALYAIGDFLLTKRVERNHQRNTVTLNADDSRFGEAALNPEAIMIEREERAEKHKAIRKAMSMLTPKQQKVIKLYYFDKLTLNQIAKIQGITPQSVFDIIRRAQKAMKNFLETS